MGLPKLGVSSRRPTLVRSHSSGSIGTRAPASIDVALSPVSALDRHLSSEQGIAPKLGGGNEQTQTEQTHPLVPDKEGEQPSSNEPAKQPTANKILLVDDNHINLKVLKAYMKKLGREFETATNGKEAVDAFTQNPEQFAGVLMDISMPVMDGFEATRQIRAFECQHGLSSVAVLVLTGVATQEAHQNAYESGADDFLTKPMSLKSLREAMESRDLLPTPLEEKGKT